MTKTSKNWIVAILAVILTFSIALLGVCDLKSARAEETIDKCYDYKIYCDTSISGEVYAGKTVVFDDILKVSFPSLSNYEIDVVPYSPTNLTFYLTHGTDDYEVASLEGKEGDGEGVWFTFPEVLEFDEDVIESISSFTSMHAIDFRNETLKAYDQFCVLGTEYQVTDLKVGDVVDGKMIACPSGLDMYVPGTDNPMAIYLSDGSVYYSVGDLWYTQPGMSDAFSDDDYIYKGNWCNSNLVGINIPESDEDVTVTSISYGGAGTSLPYGMKIVSEISEEPIEPPVEDPIEPPVEEPTEPPVEEPTEPPVQEPSDDAAGQTPDVPKDDNVKDDASKDDNKNDVVDEEKGTFKDWVKDNGGLLIALGAFLAIMIITAIVLKKKRR